MSDDAPSRLAVVGAGLIGERHARLIARQDGKELCAIIDPTETATNLASDLAVPHHPTLDTFLDQKADCDGVIIATPNETHREIALACVDRGLPCLIEKPLAANSDDAKAIAEAAHKSGVPVLVGHHRRHHAVSRNLKGQIDSGEFGEIVGAQLTWMLRKPDDYFEAGEWRIQKGGGPVWINFIHEIDLLRFFLGEIVEVSAMLSNKHRSNAVEDAGVINLRFESGALASAMVSDCTPSPWHFEGGSGENPNIAETGESGLRIFGTKGAVEFPSKIRWQHENADGHWGTPISRHKKKSKGNMAGELALVEQLEHFADVIRSRTKPLVSAQDGLQSVRVVEAIHQSAVSKTIVEPERGYADGSFDPGSNQLLPDSWLFGS